MPLPRRRFITHSLASAFVFGCSAPGSREATSAAARPDSVPATPVATPASTTRVAPAVECTPTAPNIEGPFFRPGAPLVGDGTSLVPGTPLGTPVEIAGQISGRDCQPLPGAVVEVWHADHEGAYDHDGFRYRGRFVTDERGVFELRTIVPGHYRVGEGYRPAHVHIKVHAEGRPSLTTQLYFEGDPYNEGDPFIHESLIMPTTRVDGRMRARFDFVV